MSFSVAIVGRPNVGKSTLFNRLVGKRLAIVDDTPGVTRDRREGEGRLADLRFRLFDTAGLEEAFDDSLEARMRRQTEHAIAEAQVALFLIDARAGVTPLDRHFAAWLRAQSTPVVLLANKCEGRVGETGRYEAYELGLGEPLPLSAEHGEGLGELYDVLQPMIDAAAAAAPVASGENDAEDGPLQLAIVGRPNVGKSTLINWLVGEDRLLTGPEAGITRDAIAVAWRQDGREVRLIDTAGLRRKAKVTERVEGLSTAETARAIQYAQVVALLIDPDEGLGKQDLTIARKVTEEGRALLLVVNKWDTVADAQAVRSAVQDRLSTSLPQVKGIPVLTLSALSGRGVERLMPAVFGLYDLWNTRIATAGLNRWLADMQQHHPAPLGRNKRRIKLRYMTQIKTRPPTFALFVNQLDTLPESYLRYLENALRDDFNLPGVPLRLMLRKGRNPYAE